MGAVGFGKNCLPKMAEPGIGIQAVVHVGGIIVASAGRTRTFAVDLKAAVGTNPPIGRFVGRPKVEVTVERTQSIAVSNCT